MRMLVVTVVAATMLLAGCTATPPAEESTPAPPSVTLPEPADPLPLDQVAAYGSVATMNAGSNCTGTLIDTGVPSGPAYILTNGHCVGDVGRSAQTTTLGEEWFGTAEFFRAKGNLSSTLTVDVAELAYSTMRLTDTAIVRLKPTLGDLEKQGVRPVRIADAEPKRGEKVVNVGVPVQNLMDDQHFLRKGQCVLGAQHTVIEFFWMWNHVWSNDCPGIIQGSSGSPLFETDAGGPTRIVGMINTTTDGVTAAQGGACWLNRPCEVTAGMVRMKEDTSYAQSVAGIGDCFDKTTGIFTPPPAGVQADRLGECPLPMSDVWAEEGGGSFRGGGEPDGTGRLPTVRLVARTAGTVRTALAPLGDGSTCSKSDTYAAATAQAVPAATEDSPWDQSIGLTLPVDLPPVEGHYAYCAVVGDDYAGAATVLFAVDRTPPVVAASADVERHDGAVTVRPHLNPPELSNIRYKWGPHSRVDCSDTSTFRDFLIVPLTLTRADLPATYCIYGMDAAGNRTPVTTIEIPRN